METVETIRSGGRDRQVLLVHPEEVAGPLVLVLHGSTQRGRTVRGFSGRTFDAYIGHGAVVAYPDGYRGNWNDARLGITFPARQEGVDDVAFLREVAESVRPRQTYAIGFSNGGSMVLRLLHEVPGMLAGAAVIAVTQPAPENFPVYADPPAAVPMVWIHGTEDPISPYGGGVAQLLGVARGRGESAPDSAAQWARLNGITAPPVRMIVPKRDEADPTYVELTAYEQEGRPPVRLYTVVGGGHVIPGPVEVPPSLGRATRQLVASEVIGDFFGLNTPS